MSTATVKSESMMEKASGAVAGAGRAVGDMAASAGRSVDRAVGAVGTGMESLADSARKSLPHEGMMGAASKAVADGLESAGHYVEQRQLSGMAADLGTLIRKHPIQSALIGVGLGYLLYRCCQD